MDLLVTQIDGIHIEEDLMLLAAVRVDGLGDKHPLAVIEGATENAAITQALLDNLIERGLTPRFAVVVLPNRRRCAAQGKRLHLARRGVFGCP